MCPSSQDPEDERREKLAKAFTQTSNPTIVRTVSQVIKVCVAYQQDAVSTGELRIKTVNNVTYLLPYS